MEFCLLVFCAGPKELCQYDCGAREADDNDLVRRRPEIVFIAFSVAEHAVFAKGD